MRPRPCSWFQICREGSESFNNSVTIPVGIFVLFVLPFGVWRYYLRVRDKKRKERDEVYKKQAEAARINKS